jgi:alginate O-acetyltransferase complex protein AlgI
MAMSFVSIPFALLLLIVLALLLMVRAPWPRKLILLAASCSFYAYWDWRFLGLLAAVTVIDFSISRLLVAARAQSQRRLLMAISVITNLSILGFFKYFDFFINSLNVALSPVGWHLQTLYIILPIGISFYTFETLSYVIDVYRGVAAPAASLLDYAVFITFFPRLVAGPIMRAQQFLPQLTRGIEITPDNLVAGTQLFLQGMVKKVVVADNIATFVDRIYATPAPFSSVTVWLAVLAYSVQVYCDFSGYTDMARGIGRMLGFELPMNFNLPYVSQSLSEFWQRWHISLSTWLRDYLYFPLGGSRRGRVRGYLNLMVTMLLGGLWHGASWNFVIWGGLNGLGLLIERAVFGSRRRVSSWHAPRAWAQAVAVLVVVSIIRVFFRSPSMSAALAVFEKMLFINSRGLVWIYTPALLPVAVVVLGGLLLRTLNISVPTLTIRRPYTWAALSATVLLIYFTAPLHVSPFIYFQF